MAAHRKEGILSSELSKLEKYDALAGKIANDNTNRVITAYINGLYGEVGLEAADNMAISLLMPENLTNQICFRTQKAIEVLAFADIEEVPL